MCQNRHRFGKLDFLCIHRLRMRLALPILLASQGSTIASRAWSATQAVYFTVEGAIIRVEPDGSNPKFVYEAGVSSSFTRIAIANTHGTVYGTLQCFNCFTTTFMRCNLDGSHCQNIAFADLGSPFYGAAIDAPLEYVYWTIADSGGIIRRASYDGSNIQTVLTSAGENLIGIDVDHVAGQIYWTTYEVGSSSSGKVFRADLTGLNREQILDDLNEPQDLALDVGGSKIYWTEHGSGRIRRADLPNGANVQDILAGLDRPGAIALDVEDDTMYWASLSGMVFKARLDGSSVQMISSGWNLEVLALDLLELTSVDSNPFLHTFLGTAPSPQTKGIVTIRFGVERHSHVALEVYNVAGRCVRRLLSGSLDPGVYAREWDGNDTDGRSVAAGVYIARLRAGDQTLTRKIVLAK